MKKYKVAIVGASGLVGRTMLEVLSEFQIPIEKLVLYTSDRTAGYKVNFQGKEYEYTELTEDFDHDIDFALFSAGKAVSLRFAPQMAEAGIVVIDNSSAWRMHQDVPLVVPEVNPNDLLAHKNIIANPNCSTIQLMLPLKVLSDNYGLKRVVVSTYQSVSGAGQKGVDKLNAELKGEKSDLLSQHPIAYNTFFHSFDEGNDYTEEEIKMIAESRKILHLPELNYTATCVRLPILGGHGESVNIELEKDFELNEVIRLLSEADNCIILNGTKDDNYPTVKTSMNRNEVFIGRIRRDDSQANTLNLWVVADNLRKGAATNAVQIAKKMIELGLFK